MHYILLFQDIDVAGKTILMNHSCDFIFCPVNYGQSLSKILGICEAIVVRNDPVTAEMMSRAPHLKVIAKHGSGYDNIDVEAATERGIQVVYVPGVNSDSVADMTILHILACARKLTITERNLQAGNYNIRYQMNDTHQLKGKTLGLLGYGHIGKQVARRAKYGFEMNVIANSITHVSGYSEDHLVKFVSRDEIFLNSDYVSIHIPSTAETIHSIGKREFSMMKPTAYLINTSRGNILCQSELIQALRTHRIAGAGLDVYEKKFTEEVNVLLSLDNVLLTPHCSGLTKEASENISVYVAKQILQVFHNQTPDFPVNHIITGYGLNND